MLTRTALVILGAGYLLAAAAAPARACGVPPGPPPAPLYPFFSATDFPPNGLFISPFEWRTDHGERLRLRSDDALSAFLNLDVRRPSEGVLPPGSVWHPTEDCPAFGDCRHALRVADVADSAAPEAVEIVELVTRLVDDPSGGGGFSCPDVDTLRMRLRTSDDTTPAENMLLLAFIGPTPEQARTKIVPDAVFGFDGEAAEPDVSTVTLGASEGRMRDGEPFRSPTTFCFSVAAMDWAGNTGPRSTPRCLNTTDPSDPTVQMVESQGCAVVSPGSSPASPGTAVGSLLLLGGLVARRRARSPAPSASGGFRSIARLGPWVG